MNYKRVIYILLIGTITLLASCSDNRHDDNSWFKPIDDFVAEHQQLMQSHPDSMAMLIRRLQCNERPELSDQWKRLIIAKCYFLKGADAECQNLIDSVNDFAVSILTHNTHTRYNPMPTTFRVCCFRL